MNSSPIKSLLLPLLIPVTVFAYFYSLPLVQSLTPDLANLVFFPILFLLPFALIIILILVAIFSHPSPQKAVLKPHEAEDKFRLLIENISDVVWSMNDTGTFTYVSPNVTNVLGFTADELYTNPKAWASQINTEDVSLVQKAYDDLFSQNKGFNIEFRYKTKAGKPIWLQNRSNKMYEKYGTKYADGVLTDITQKKADLEKYQFQSQLLETVNRAIVFTDVNGKIMYWSKFAEVFYGWTKEEAMGKSLIDLTWSKESKEKSKDIMERLQKGLSWAGEYTVQRKDGTQFTVIGSSSPFYNDQRKMIGIVGMTVDISSRKEAEDQLKERTHELEVNQKHMIKLLSDLEDEKNKVTAIVTSIGEGVFVTDVKGTITLMNREAEKLVGYTMNEAIGKDYSQIFKFALEDGTDYPSVIKNVMETGQVQQSSQDVLLINKNGSKIPVTDSAAPIKNERGETFGCVVVLRDVTEEREINRIKTEFVSVASHELRTPLSTINWYIELVLTESGPLSEEQRNYLQEAYIGGQNMVKLVNSLLNVARIESNTFMVEPAPVNVVEIVQEVLNELKPRIEDKHLHVTVDNQQIPVILLDPNLTNIIIHNLVVNAIKYTLANGSIAISLKIVKQKEFVTNYQVDTDSLLIQISDTGMGIPKNQQSKIFTKMFRADNVRKADTEGTGLGLYMIKSLIERNNGKIWFASEENKGTTFFVVLPLSGMKKKEGTRKLNTAS